MDSIGRVVPTQVVHWAFSPTYLFLTGNACMHACMLGHCLIIQEWNRKEFGLVGRPKWQVQYMKGDIPNSSTSSYDDALSSGMAAASSSRSVSRVG
jgi:hypothetical protein